MTNLLIIAITAQNTYRSPKQLRIFPRINEHITLFEKIASCDEKSTCERWGPIVKIAVIGTGALGCHFCGKLAATGHDVWLLYHR